MIPYFHHSYSTICRNELTYIGEFFVSPSLIFKQDAQALIAIDQRKKNVLLIISVCSLQWEVLAFVLWSVGVFLDRDEQKIIWGHFSKMSCPVLNNSHPHIMSPKPEFFYERPTSESIVGYFLSPCALHSLHSKPDIRKLDISKYSI